MDSSETLDRAVASARLDVDRDQHRVTQDITYDPLQQATLARDERRLNQLEQKEEKSQSNEQSQGFGW